MSVAVIDRPVTFRRFFAEFGYISSSGRLAGKFFTLYAIKHSL